MIILCIILETVTAETFNDTFHIAATVVLGIISYFLLRLIKEHDNDREKIDKMDTKLTNACNDIGWIKRSIRRSGGYRVEESGEGEEEIN